MERNYWLHRISHCGETASKLLKNGVLSIGFSSVSSEKFIVESRNNWSDFEKYIEEAWGPGMRSRHSLWRFVTDMEKGDFVVVPRPKRFSVYKIIDERCFSRENLTEGDLKNIDQEDCHRLRNSENKIDLGFFRRVEEVMPDIPRKEYADSKLTARLKIRTTNSNIKDLSNSVHSAIDNFKERKPINIRSQIQEKIVDNTLATIKEYLNPDKFEKLVQWYFKKAGATEVLIPPKNEKDKEGDADIIATFEPIKTIYYVQAKYHQGKTSNYAMNQIHDYLTNKEMDDDGYSKIAWVITTAEDFDDTLDKETKENGVQVIKGREFTERLLDVGLSNLDEVL